MVAARRHKQTEAHKNMDGFQEGPYDVDSEAQQEVSSSKHVYSTRSQSGRTIKRPVKDDDLQSQTQPVRKRQKTTSTKTQRKSVKKPAPRYEEDSQSEEDDYQDELQSADEFAPIPSTSASPSSQDPESALEPQPLPLPVRYGTNRPMRANLPVPVPNLTKKSRGRRVPTRSALDAAGNTGKPVNDPDYYKRSYVCSVEGCGKCFHRGEHLKRHIRSIHTHDKPFKCTYNNCEKFFNRHDNLLQHIKVHKAAQVNESFSSQAAAEDIGGSDEDDQEEIFEPAEATRNSPSPRGRTVRTESHPLLSLAAAASRPVQPQATVSNMDSGYSSSPTLASIPSTGSSATLASSLSSLTSLSSIPTMFSGTSLASFSSFSSLGSILRTSYLSPDEAASAETYESEMPVSRNMAVSSLRTEMPERSSPKKYMHGLRGEEGAGYQAEVPVRQR